MNELVIPASPLWFKISVMACAPDNTLVYGRQTHIVVIKETSAPVPEVKLIEDAHTKSITSLSLNKKWKDPNCYAVSLGEESIIRVWNIETFEKKTSNKDHVEHKKPVVGAVFAGEDRVVSAAQNGLIFIWNINTNESKPVKDLFKSKVTLTCLSSCPHASWLLAFGLNNGGVVVADLRRNGKILYNLRGHYEAVVSLSWCPAPVNVFPRNTQSRVKNKTPDNEDKKNENEISDFLKECNLVKSQILGHDVPKSDMPSNTEKIIVEAQNNDYEDTPRVEIEGREFPVVFDPSGDFFDDSVEEMCQSVLKNKEVEEEKYSEDIKETEKNSDSKEKDELSEEREKCSEDTKETEKNSDVNQKDELNGVEACSEDAQDIEKNTVSNEEDELNDQFVLKSKEVEEEEREKCSEEENELKDGDEDEVVGEDSGIIVEPLDEEPRIEYLLASSGRDRRIYIWRAGTDGRMQTFLELPRRKNRQNRNSVEAWISLCWISPSTILSSSLTGQLLAWSLPKRKQVNQQFRVIHNEHTPPIFNIVAPYIHFSEYNWRDAVDLKVWTWGHDGRLINYDLTKEKMNICYSTITASVTCFDSSSLDPNRVAIGLRNGGIRIWDLSLPHTKMVIMHKYQQKSIHKVSAVAWHPVKEMVLAFGTEEGRVGFLELIPNKSTLFPHYFRNHVYKVEWGPINGNSNNLGIYVVVEGKFAVYDTQKSNEDAVILDFGKKIHAFKFAWKPDFSLLLLNGNDGCLLLLNRELIPITTFYPGSKGLNAIEWHPDALTDNTESSPRCNWFAATTTKGLIVYDCCSIEKKDNLADNLVVQFEGHLKPTLALAWCPFEGNRIVSIAADGLTQVWDVTTKQLISTFVEQYLSHYPVVLWSPVDPDLIITGDKFVTVWRISKNPPRNDEEFLNERKRVLAKCLKSDGDKTEISKAKSFSKTCIVPMYYVSNDENISVQVEDMRKILDSEENIESSDPLNLYGSKEQVYQLLDANYKQHKTEGKHKFCELISVWKGNVGDCVQEAITENRVTPSIITLAPMVSPKLWQDACESYAKKLSEDATADPFETATYFLACHKVEEAINVLCLCFKFREALALAKHRLPPNSEIIIRVTEKWADYCILNGNFENAAFCYISIKQYENAAKVLSRRTCVEFLEFSAELAEKAGNKELKEAIEYKMDQAKGTKSETVEDLPSRFEAMIIRQQSNGGSTEESVDEQNKE